jgi:hypothetical protein
MQQFVQQQTLLFLGAAGPHHPSTWVSLLVISAGQNDVPGADILVLVEVTYYECIRIDCESKSPKGLIGRSWLAHDGAELEIPFNIRSVIELSPLRRPAKHVEVNHLVTENLHAMAVSGDLLNSYQDKSSSHLGGAIGVFPQDNSIESTAMQRPSPKERY